MFCFKCGSNLPENSKACNFCGASFLALGKDLPITFPPPVKPVTETTSSVSKIQTPPKTDTSEKNTLSIPSGTLLANRFKVERQIGHGDLSQVFLAQDTKEGRRIALKVIPFSQASVQTTFEEVRRELVGRDKVNDFTYVVKNYGFFTVSNYNGFFLLMLTMELALLGNFRSWLSMNRNHVEFRRRSGVDFFVQAVSGIKALHSNGIVHLDLKPENLLLCGDPETCTLKVSGFEVSPYYKQRLMSRKTSVPMDWEAFSYRSPDHFIAPRQEEIQPASDIYSLGVILFEILDTYGKPPFDGSSEEIRNKHLGVLPPKIRGIDEKLEAILKRCLAKKPEDRFSNAEALHAAFQGYYGGIIGKRKILLYPPNSSSYSNFPAAQSVAPKGEMEKFLTNSVGMRLRLINAGSCEIGSSKGKNPTGPVHKAVINKPFYLGVFPVTQEQYEKVMGGNPSHFKWPGHPVESVSWEDAKEFCRRLSEAEGRKYRLPTESEWEYACRAGTTTEYYWGDQFAGDYCWCSPNSDRESHEVGTRLANPWEIFDMCGNVWEWCEDWFEPYTDKEVVDHKGPKSGTTKILRGGSWCDNPDDCRCATRGKSDPTILLNVFGFRVVASTGGTSINQTVAV